LQGRLADRGNPRRRNGTAEGQMDCFVAALLAMTKGVAALHLCQYRSGSLMLATISSSFSFLVLSFVRGPVVRRRKIKRKRKEKDPEARSVAVAAL
jgi:hypothetical protein